MGAQMNALTDAYEFLEARQEGLYHEMIRLTLQSGGITHSSPDCFCLAVPVHAEPQVIVVLFACGSLSALWRLARMYEGCFTHIRFRRDFKSGHGDHTFSIKRFLTKQSLTTIIYHV